MISLGLGDALDHYDQWDAPSVIFANGPIFYGADQYARKHIAKWTERALPSTILWFWNNHQACMEVHPILKEFGWHYRSSIIWDKSQWMYPWINVPIVTEQCSYYVRDANVRLSITPNNLWTSEQSDPSEMMMQTGIPVHPYQKPLQLMHRLVTMSSTDNDIVWEPFGGLCSFSIAAAQMHRKCFAAEINLFYFQMACQRIRQENIPLSKQF